MIITSEVNIYVYMGHTKWRVV